MAADISTTLRVIIENAPKLRMAGVHSLSIDGVSMVLLPPDPPEPVEDKPTGEDTEPRNDLDDPTTYGRLPGSPAPGFVRPTDLPPQE